MEKKVKKEKAKEPWIKAIKSWIIYAVVITIFVTVFMHDATISDDLGADNGKYVTVLANIDGIVGFAKACEIVVRDIKTNNHKVRAISDYFTTKLVSTIENVKFNIETKQKLPHILSVGFVGVNAESLMTKLDLNGVAIASGCYGDDVSHVLSAIGMDNDNASCSVRFSFGKNNSYEEIDKAVSIIANCVEDLRSYSSTFGMKTRKRKGDK